MKRIFNSKWLNFITIKTSQKNKISLFRNFKTLNRDVLDRVIIDTVIPF